MFLSFGENLLWQPSPDQLLGRIGRIGSEGTQMLSQSALKTVIIEAHGQPSEVHEIHEISRFFQFHCYFSRHAVHV